MKYPPSVFWENPVKSLKTGTLVSFQKFFSSSQYSKLYDKENFLFILSVAGTWLAGCDDDENTSSYGYIETTQEDSITYVLEGYEEASQGYNNLTPDGLNQPFYIQNRQPHLNADNYYVEHSVTINGNNIYNYALEWNNTLKHSTWATFSFDETTKAENTSRPNEEPCAIDPQLPEGMSPQESNHRNDGFDKEHLVASSDRLYSVEANAQTFYYNNISPMFNSFNGGFWASFEVQVLDWARSDNFDYVYVAKGGTLNHLLTNFTTAQAGNDGRLPTTDASGLTIHGLACPQYDFMAILATNGDSTKPLDFGWNTAMTTATVIITSPRQA